MPARRTKAAATPALPPTPLEQFIAADNAKQRKQPKTEYQRLTAAQEKKHLEAEYLASLKAYPTLPQPQPQYTKLVPGRHYRADFAWLDVRLIVECDGGQWLGSFGGHTSGSGMDRDRRRDADCQLAGWMVLRVTADMIRDGSAADYTKRHYTMLSNRRQQQRGVA